MGSTENSEEDGLAADALRHVTDVVGGVIDAVTGLAGDVVGHFNHDGEIRDEGAGDDFEEAEIRDDVVEDVHLGGAFDRSSEVAPVPATGVPAAEAPTVDAPTAVAAVGDSPVTAPAEEAVIRPETQETEPSRTTDAVTQTDDVTQTDERHTAPTVGDPTPVVSTVTESAPAEPAIVTASAVQGAPVEPITVDGTETSSPLVSDPSWPAPEVVVPDVDEVADDVDVVTDPVVEPVLPVADEVVVDPSFGTVTAIGDGELPDDDGDLSLSGTVAGKDLGASVDEETGLSLRGADTSSFKGLPVEREGEITVGPDGARMVTEATHENDWGSARVDTETRLDEDGYLRNETYAGKGSVGELDVEGERSIDTHLGADGIGASTTQEGTATVGSVSATVGTDAGVSIGADGAEVHSSQHASADIDGVELGVGSSMGGAIGDGNLSAHQRVEASIDGVEVGAGQRGSIGEDGLGLRAGASIDGQDVFDVGLDVGADGGNFGLGFVSFDVDSEGVDGVKLFGDDPENVGETIEQGFEDLGAGVEQGLTDLGASIEDAASDVGDEILGWF